MIYKDIAEYEENDSELAKYTILELHKEIERLENIIKEVRKKLINSKEYKAVKSLDFNSKMSILIELEEILDKVDKGE